MDRRVVSIAAVVASTILGNRMAALALVPPDYDPSIHDRFTSGYIETQMLTEAPTPNTAPGFLGDGYDLSGIGWNTVTGPGCAATVAGVTMVSPMHVAQSWHLTIPEGKITFLNRQGELQYTIEQLKIQLLSEHNDGALAPLLAPVPRSAQVSYYAILDIGAGDAPLRYDNQPLLVYGRAARFASSTFEAYSTTRWTELAGVIDFGGVEMLGGDSGSPSFIPHAGQLTLAGTHWQRRPSSGEEYEYNGGIDASWVNPYSIAAANGIMAQAGYALKVIAIPTKVWDGGAGTGTFTTAGNWAPNVIPNREGIAFDAESANGQYNIHLNSSVSIKGITFTSAPGQGFTFGGSATLQLGTGGLINDSPQTQTFNGDIRFHYLIKTSTGSEVETGAQHWSANSGNLVVNGNVDNNVFQLVVDGAKDTFINGVISGWGGLGKEGSGKLNLAGANLYRGYTTLTEGTLVANNVTGSATGSGNVNVWGGRIQGIGAIAGSITFRAIGDPQWLAPGNADVGQRGILSVGGGVALSSDTTMEIHLDSAISGSGYDQLRVSGGDIDLGGASLEVILDNLSAARGTIFWIVNNMGNGDLLGEYAGLSDGGVVGLLGSDPLTIHYGADWESGSLAGGNDVAVFIVPEPGGLGLLGCLFVLIGARKHSYGPQGDCHVRS